MIDNTMFDNPFADQHRFHYFDPSDNKNDEMLEPSVILNIDDNIDNDVEVDVDDEIISHVPKIRDVFRSSFDASHD
jgi:hypothetical protein